MTMATDQIRLRDLQQQVRPGRARPEIIQELDHLVDTLATRSAEEPCEEGFRLGRLLLLVAELATVARFDLPGCFQLAGRDLP